MFFRPGENKQKSQTFLINTRETSWRWPKDCALEKLKLPFFDIVLCHLIHLINAPLIQSPKVLLTM